MIDFVRNSPFRTPLISMSIAALIIGLLLATKAIP